MSATQTTPVTVKPLTEIPEGYSCLGRETRPDAVQPAAHVWTEDMPKGFEEKKAFFRREGFLILRQMLSPSDLGRLEEEVIRFCRDHKTLPRIREGFSLEPNQDTTRDSPTFRKIGGVSSFSEPFNQVMRHPKVMEILHDLMGPVIELYRDVIMMKPARVGREKPWHQDSSYWPWNPMDLCSAMTALDDASPENGCLQVIPRTHHIELQHYGKELQIDLTPEQQAQTYYVPLKAGDTLLFHSLLLHASEPNRSDQPRRVVINSYKNPELKYIGKGKQPEPIVVHDVRPKGEI